MSCLLDGRGRGHGRRGHRDGPAGVESSVSTQHNPHETTTPPVRCLRHHVWMAACRDCRAAYAVSTTRARDQLRTAG